MTRLARLAAGLSEPLLVTDAINVRYLTGFESSNSALLVEPEGTTTLYTDFRYLEAAARDRGRRGHPDPTRRGRRACRAPRRPAGRIRGARGSPTCSGRRSARAGPSSFPPEGSSRRSARSRTRASSSRSAAQLRSSDAVYEALSHETIVGRTEVEVAWWLERTMREHGAEALAFDSIVAAGVNGSRPHADPADVPIEEGTLVTVDMGCVVDGYRSDCTRTFATGDLPAQLEEAYGLVAQAQLDGLAAVRAGAFGPDVDAASRVRIAEAGLARCLRARARPRRRARHPRGAEPPPGVDRHARRRQRRHRRAGPLPPGSRGLQDRGPRRRDRGRVRDPLVVHEGDAGRRLARRSGGGSTPRNSASGPVASSRRDVSPQAPSSFMVPLLRSTTGSARPTRRSPTSSGRT